MRLLSLSEASIQPRTSLEKFDKICQNLLPAVLQLRFKIRLSTAGAPWLRTCMFSAPNCIWQPKHALFKCWQLQNTSKRLVLGCIDASDSESRRIFHDFSKSTRSAFFCTAPNPKFQQHLPNFAEFRRIF